MNTISADVSSIPLWDGETADPAGRQLNRFGGNPVQGIRASVRHVTEVTYAGIGAFRIDTNGTIPAHGFDFIATSLTDFGPSPRYVDTRDFAKFTFSSVTTPGRRSF